MSLYVWMMFLTHSCRSAVRSSCPDQLAQHLKAISGQSSQGTSRSLAHPLAVDIQRYAHLIDGQMDLPITLNKKIRDYMYIFFIAWLGYGVRILNYKNNQRISYIVHKPYECCRKRENGLVIGQRSVLVSLLCSPD